MDSTQDTSVIGEIQEDIVRIPNGHGQSAYVYKNGDGVSELHICDENSSADIVYRGKYESEEIRNIYWLDHEHLFFSGYKDRVYHLDSDELEETDIITRLCSDYFDYGFLNDITSVSGNTIIFNMDGRIGKVFITIKNGAVTFSSADPSNPPGTWLNSLQDAHFSNLNAQGYAAADADTYGYTYYSYGDLFHPDLILKDHDGYSKASREMTGYFDEDDCYYLTFHGERLYYACFWYTYDAEPGKGWEEWIYSFYHGLIRINKDYTDKKVLYEGSVSFLNAYHNDIYFLDEEGNILKINWNDEIETVYEGNCVSLYIKEDQLYYSENGVFYQRSLLDGTTQALLSKPHIYPSVIGSDLYYLTNEGTLTKYDLIHQTESILMDSKSLVFYCVYGNGIYYNAKDSPGIIRYRDMNTGEEQVVYQGLHVYSFILLGDYLFFQDAMEGYMSIRTDGSEFNNYCKYN